MTKPLTPEERQNLRTNWLEAAQASAEGGASIEVVRSDLLELIDWTWRLLDECAMHERSGVMLLNWMKEDADFRLQTVVRAAKAIGEQEGRALRAEASLKKAREALWRLMPGPDMEPSLHDLVMILGGRPE